MDTTMKFGKASGKALEDMNLEEIKYYFAWYKNAVESKKHPKYQKDNEEMLAYIAKLYIPLVQGYCLDLAEEYLILINEPWHNLRLVDEIFLNHTSLKKFLSLIITEENLKEMSSAANILKQLVAKAKLKKEASA